MPHQHRCIRMRTGNRAAITVAGNAAFRDSMKTIGVARERVYCPLGKVGTGTGKVPAFCLTASRASLGARNPKGSFGSGDGHFLQSFPQSVNFVLVEVRLDDRPTEGLDG
jgi:hypothetical protein